MERYLKEELAKLVRNPICWDVPLSGYTSFAIGGPAQALITVSDSRELQSLMIFLHENALRWQVIGKGTNILVADSGFQGVILLLADEFKKITFQDPQEKTVAVRAGSGCSLTRLSGLCIRKSCSGLEFACGIPGTVGGAVIMNAGAWGENFADILTAVEIMTEEGPHRMAREHLQFSYRRWHNHAEGRNQVVTAVEMNLRRGDSGTIRKRCAELLRKRRAKQPKGLGSAGSFFKNPQGESAGRLIEKCGCKGMRVGGAMISLLHANFLVNAGGATAADVKNLMNIVQEKVQKECGVFLEPEVHFL